MSTQPLLPKRGQDTVLIVLMPSASVGSRPTRAKPRIVHMPTGHKTRRA